MAFFTTARFFSRQISNLAIDVTLIVLGIW
jgi:hypothetical protein